MKKNLNKIIMVARGQELADMVFKNAYIFNSFSGQFELADLAISEGYIAGIGQYCGLIEYDLSGKYITPGFVDAHVHIESSMLQPQEFAKVLLLSGVTSIFADPHEIVNVLGVQGMDYMLSATADLPVDVFFTLPSCVPASPFETAGAVFGAQELSQYRDRERVVGLGELMNFPGLINQDVGVLERLSSCEGLVVDGHAPSVSGKDLNAYIAAGVSSDHEAFSIPEAREKLNKGMYLYMREGSAAKNLLDLLGVVDEYNYRRICFATDDRNLNELIEEGSINYAVKLAVQNGIKLGYAINMASLNVFERFGIKHRGAIAAGYRADLLVFENLNDWQVHTVVKNGRIVVENYTLKDCQAPKMSPPQSGRITLPEHIDLFIADKYGQGLANVIKTLPGQIVTEKWLTHVPVVDGGFIADTERCIQKIAVLERHLGTGNIGLGLISLQGMTRGAIASTVAHDAHNPVVLGCNDADMQLAISEITQMGGGQVVVNDGEVLARLPLPIAGLMSTDGYKNVLQQVKLLDEAAYTLGIDRQINPFMLLSFVCLSVIPALKITDRGLVDVEKFDFTDTSAQKL